MWIRRISVDFPENGIGTNFRLRIGHRAGLWLGCGLRISEHVDIGEKVQYLAFDDSIYLVVTLLSTELIEVMTEFCR